MIGCRVNANGQNVLYYYYYIFFRFCLVYLQQNPPARLSVNEISISSSSASFFIFGSSFELRLQVSSLSDRPSRFFSQRSRRDCFSVFLGLRFRFYSSLNNETSYRSEHPRISFFDVRSVRSEYIDVRGFQF